MDMSLITVSYRGDFALARELCASVDRFVAPDIEHVLVVPKSDASLFAPLARMHRRLVLVEEVLPRDFIRAFPSFTVKLGPLFERRLREMWLTPRGPVRGWIIQQIVKLSSDRATTRDVILFADSDLEFVRPLTKKRLARGDAVRLYRRPGETKESVRHRSWHRAAAHLLGLPTSDYFGADYIGNLISWRRDTLKSLQARITKVHGAPWQNVLAGTRTFSEYILYGVFADHVPGPEGEHFPDMDDWTHASWHYEIPGGCDLERFVAEFGAQHLAVLIQSTTGLSVDERRQVIARMINQLKRVA